MAWKDIEKQRAAIRHHYYANRQYYIDKVQLKRRNLRQWLREFKESSPCADCNVNYPYYVMDFDHLGEKNWEINKLVNTGNAKRVREEIAGCDLVCSNCHRIRTYKRMASSKL